MAKLTKQQTKLHAQAEDLLWGTDKPLRQHDVWFVLESWHPGSTNNTGIGGAFFTPLDLASQFNVFTNVEGRVIDLGAGIGHLLCALKSGFWNWDGCTDIVAIEINPDYVKVGKRLFPEVNWICGDIFDLELLHEIGMFDTCVSNPPFGKLPSTKSRDWMKYKGDGALMAAEVALYICKRSATMLLPQTLVPFKDTGVRQHQEIPRESWTTNLRRFVKTFPDVEFGPTTVDCSAADWKDANPTVELVSVGFDCKPPLPLPPLPTEKPEQLALIES